VQIFAHVSSWHARYADERQECLLIGVDRKRSAAGQSDAIDFSTDIRSAHPEGHLCRALWFLTVPDLSKKSEYPLISGNDVVANDFVYKTIARRPTMALLDPLFKDTSARAR
jgi:hypothetical protein